MIKIVYISVILSVISLIISSLYQKETQNSVNSEVDIAIIGCGISGTYCAAKISQKFPENKIVLYDVSDRIGGRLLSIRLPGMPHIPVELGGMRFSASHHRVDNLVKSLGLPTNPFSQNKNEGLLYLRGVYLNEKDFTDLDKIPYKLSESEKGKSPSQILLDVVKIAIPDAEKLTYEEWYEKKDNYLWNGKYLQDYSWQQFLAENMSDEAWQFLIDLGYIQLTAEVSMYTQLDGFFEKSEGFPSSILTGYQSLPEKLARIAKKNGVQIELESKLISIDQKGNEEYRLSFQMANGHIKTVYAKNVISTTTPPALLNLWDASPFLQQLTSRESLDQFWPNPLTKLFFAYHSPWWRELGLHDGSSTTTLPLRSCFYFGTESEAYEGEKDNNNALLLASYQGAFPLFWKTCAERTGLTNESNDYRPDDEAIRFGQYFLKKLHGIEEIPLPYAAAFFNWNRPPHYGGYFFWKVGVKPEEWYDKYCRLGGKGKIFIVGSDYSIKQGWVEGALETCDKLLFRYFQIDEDDKMMLEGQASLVEKR